jgi:GntR family transcriptional repressor for pyruvate dehydrogenase complex
VREALRGLAVLGLVAIRQGHGTFVQSPVPLNGPEAFSTDAISAALARGLTDELLEAREIIEVRMAGLAAQRATPDDLRELEALIHAAREAHLHKRPSFLLSAQFHLGIARASHNDVIEAFVASYVSVMAQHGTVIERLPGYVEWEIKEHDGIRMAIAAHDTRLAATRMRDHLKNMTIHYEHLAAAGLRLPEPRLTRLLTKPVKTPRP